MSALDHWSKEKLYKFLKLVNVKMKIPIFYVSHNKEEFINLANNYLFFNPQAAQVIGGCAVNSSNPFETNL
jgi:ABC-type molybdate transport system ATPase subunit